MHRRSFLTHLAGGVALGLGAQQLQSETVAAVSRESRRKLIFGWTTCLTYETGSRRLGLDYFSRLLKEMAAHGMSHLTVMMASHGLYSPGNHGLAWPVRNPRLIPQLDPQAVNAQEETEFFGRLLEQAHALDIEVCAELKYLGLAGLKQGYPDTEFLTDSEGRGLHSPPAGATAREREAVESMHLCPDSDSAHDYVRDMIEDLLARYPGLKGIVLEHPSYFGHGCHCASSLRRLIADTGLDPSNASTAQLIAWKNARITERLLDLKGLVQRLRPHLRLGFYSGFSPPDGNVAGYQEGRGHGITALRRVGFDFVLPYCEGRHQDRESEEMEKVIDYLEPLPVLLHTTIRREPPRGYPLPPKGPEYIRRMIQWGKQYAETQQRFQGMCFFNEVKIPEENRRAVYESIST